ncbi:MAG: DUF1385 domain-containing protein [Dehalococcoidia bacterium]
MAGVRRPGTRFGGQAVIEGVMMRAPTHMAVAVRAPDGRIVTMSRRFERAATGRVRDIPLLRGIVTLYETLTLGVHALTWSSLVAAGKEDERINDAQVASTVAFMVTMVTAVFFIAPVLLTAWTSGILGSEYAEVLFEGVLRVVMLLAYIALLGRSPQIARVFAYHAAEHRTIHAYEHDLPLTIENVRRFPNAHARCGTAFLLTVVVLAMILFLFLGAPPLWLRLLSRIALVPVVAALAYEVLRLGQRFERTPVLGLIYRPNLWLQSFTTRDPDDAQIEVAIQALDVAIANEVQPEAAEQPLT